jgi:hypothetical protein
MPRRRRHNGLVADPHGSQSRPAARAIGPPLCGRNARTTRRDAEIGKAFMEGQHVGIGGLGEVGVDSVDDGVVTSCAMMSYERQVKTR